MAILNGNYSFDTPEWQDLSTSSKDLVCYLILYRVTVLDFHCVFVVAVSTKTAPMFRGFHENTVHTFDIDIDSVAVSVVVEFHDLHLCVM